jgi:hypothetical protein
MAIERILGRPGRAAKRMRLPNRHPQTGVSSQRLLENYLAKVPRSGEVGNAEMINFA